MDNKKQLDPISFCRRGGFFCLGKAFFAVANDALPC